MTVYETPTNELILSSDEDMISTSEGIDTSILEMEDSGWIFD